MRHKRACMHPTAGSLAVIVRIGAGRLLLRQLAVTMSVAALRFRQSSESILTTAAAAVVLTRQVFLGATTGLWLTAAAFIAPAAIAVD